MTDNKRPNRIFRIFLRFLKEKHACESYMHATQKHTHDIEDFRFIPRMAYSYCTLIGIIGQSFVWDKTPQGRKVWQNLNSEWNIIAEKYAKH